MRVLSYNIWNGGDGRLDALAAVIRREDADAVALVEATSASAAALAAELGFEFAFGEGKSILDLHLAWLSRRPIRRAENHRLPALAKTLLEIELDGIRLFAAHLASSREQAHSRESEVAAIVGVLGSVPGHNLLVGDFNALQPDDAVGMPPPGIVPRGDAREGAVRTVLAPLAAAGYVDCYRALHPDDPGFTYTADWPWLRLDYAFASPAVAKRLVACEVVKTVDAARASDHLPLVLELRS